MKILLKKFKHIWDYDFAKTLNTELNPNNNSSLEFKEVIKNIYGGKREF